MARREDQVTLIENIADDPALDNKVYADFDPSVSNRVVMRVGNNELEGVTSIFLDREATELLIQTIHEQAQNKFGADYTLTVS